MSPESCLFHVSEVPRGRWLGASTERPRLASMPFGAGHRTCIGNHFAMIEGPLLLALIAQRYQLDLAPEQVVEPEVAVTVKPKNGLKMMVRKRKDLPRRQPPIGSTLGQGSAIRDAFEDPPHDLGESRYRSSCIFTFLRSAPRSGSAWGAMVPSEPGKRGEIGKIADHDG